MAKKSLRRIDKALGRLEDRITSLERELATQRGASGASREEAIHFLDQFRAGEALGETSLGAWIAVCQDECLRGGLRTVQSREGSHARLLAERIKELGGSTSHEVPEAVQRKVMAGAGSTERSDAEKVQEFVARFPDIEQALAPIYEMACRLDHDPETQSLLRTIAQDERSTLEFFCECAQLGGR